MKHSLLTLVSRCLPSAALLAVTLLVTPSGIAQDLYDGEFDTVFYQWAVRTDAIFLNRSAADGAQSIVFGSAANPKATEVLHTGQLDPSTAWGPRVSLSSCNDGSCVEVSYFGIDGWDAVSQVTGPFSVQFPSFAHPPLGAGPTGTATFGYGSDLHNLEVNVLRRDMDDWMTLILGFRYIELSEDFGAVFNTGGGTSFYNINTNNHLFGFQLGADAHIWQRGDLSVDAWVKVGVFSNSADQSTFENLAAIGGGTANAGASGDQTAFASELGLNGLFQLTDMLAIRAGYQVFWIDRLALAPEQLDNTNPSIPLATLDLSGDLFIHGGFIGLEGLF